MTIKNFGDETFSVCDLCGRDESNQTIKKIFALGYKHICELCAKDLRDILKGAENE